MREQFCIFLAVLAACFLFSEFGNTSLAARVKPPYCIPRNRQGFSNPRNLPLCALPIEEFGPALYKPPLQPDGPIFPPWLNATLYNAGVDFGKKHFFAVFLLPIAAFTLFLSNPLISPALLGSGKSGTPSSSNHRYVATILHMQLWYETHLLEEEKKKGRGQKSFGPPKEGDDLVNPFVIESLFKIRGVHFGINRNTPWGNCSSGYPRGRVVGDDPITPNKELWAAYKKDLLASNIPQKYRDWPRYMRNLGDGAPCPDHYMNQLSLAITQFFLGGIETLMSERGGITATDDEHAGWMHFWAVIGYGLGIEDQYNVALQPTVPEARAYYQKMLEQFFYPSLFYMIDNPDVQILYESYFKGFIGVMIGENGERYVQVEQFMLLAFEDVFGLKFPTIRATLPRAQGLLRDAGLKNVVNWLARSTFVRELINGQFRKRYFEIPAKLEFGINDISDLEQIVEKSYA